MVEVKGFYENQNDDTILMNIDYDGDYAYVLIDNVCQLGYWGYSDDDTSFIFYPLKKSA